MKNRSERFVDDAKRSLEECKEKGAFAKARALFFEKACQSEDFSCCGGDARRAARIREGGYQLGKRTFKRIPRKLKRITAK